MSQDYIYAFVHLPKTGGTTFIKHLKNNFNDKEIILLEHKDLKLNHFSASKDQDYIKATRIYFSKIKSNDLKEVKVICGHVVTKEVENYFEKPVRFITFLREPRSRIISFYNYYLTQYQNDKNKKKKYYREKLLIDEKVPKISVWFRERYGKINSHLALNNYQQYLKTLGFNSLNDFYFLGLTESLNQDINFLFGLLRMNKFFIKQNISKSFIHKNEVEKQKERLEIESDKDLYLKAKKINSNFKKRNQEFLRLSKRVSVKRMLLTPFTQVIFDFRESLRRVSAYLRTKSKIYSKLIDYIKIKLDRDPLF